MERTSQVESARMQIAPAVRSAFNAPHPARGWLELLARWGFISNAIVYLIIGALAVRWALGEGGRITDPEGAFIALRRELGNGPLIALIPGFFSYALWRVLSAIYDGDGDGRTAGGIANRVFGVIKGGLYAALGMDVARLAFGASTGSEGWGAALASSSAGPAIMFVIGVGVFLFACYEIYRAYHARLSQGLRLHAISSSTRAWIIGISRFGIAARALVIGTFGWLVVRAVLSGHSARTPRATESIRTAAQSEPLLYVFIGAGLIAYGAYLIVLSKYREVRTG
jgi:hypothetical protein